VLYGLGAGAADSTDEPLSGYFNGDLVKSFRLGERGQLSVADRVRVGITLGIMTDRPLRSCRDRRCFRSCSCSIMLG